MHRVCLLQSRDCVPVALSARACPPQTTRCSLRCIIMTPVRAPVGPHKSCVRSVLASQHLGGEERASGQMHATRNTPFHYSCIARTHTLSVGAANANVRSHVPLCIMCVLWKSACRARMLVRKMDNEECDVHCVAYLYEGDLIMI